MIQRFCFVKLRDEEVPNRDKLARMTRSLLARAGVDAIVGVPADDSAERWDLSVVISMTSLDAWYAVEGRGWLADAFVELEGCAEVLKAWTFVAPDQLPD